MEGGNEGTASDRDLPHFDDIFEYLGSYNRYFTVKFFIISLSILTVGINALALVFLFPDTDFWCQVKELNTRCVELGLDDYDCLELKLDNRPIDNSSTITIDEQHCSQYNFTNYDFISNALNNLSTQLCNGGYEYDISQYKTSVTQEFDLVCDDAYLVSFLFSLDYTGVLVGAFIFGNVGDRYGRKCTVVLCMVLCAGFGLVTIASQWFWMFAILRFMSTTFSEGVYTATFVHGCELVGPSKRSLAGSFISIQWSLGYMLASLYAYLIPYWRYRILAMAVIEVFVCILICLLVPESPRWLHSVNELNKAERILKRACRISKDPQEAYDVCQTLCSEDTTVLNVKNESSLLHFKMLDLLRHRNIRTRFLIIVYIWFVNSLVYYGITLSAVNLGSNGYFTNALAGLVEIPAAILSWVAIERLGRRLTLSVTMAMAGVACAATSIFSNEALIVTMGMIGKFGIAASYSVIFIFATEIYPTPIRTTAIGVSTTIGSLGGIIAPQIIFAGVILEQLPYLIFAGLALSAGLLTLLLPETRGLKLPQTLQEGEDLGALNAIPSHGPQDNNETSV